MQKPLIRESLSVKSDTDALEWQPRYMQFPMKSYTKQGGIAVIDAWKAVKKYHRLSGAKKHRPKLEFRAVLLCPV